MKKLADGLMLLSLGALILSAIVGLSLSMSGWLRPSGFWSRLLWRSMVFICKKKNNLDF